MGTLSADQAAQAAALLQQAFVTMHGGTSSQKQSENAMSTECNQILGKVDQATSLSKDSQGADKPESSMHGAMKGSGKPPYCYRCYTKGHKMEDCSTKLYCDICDCNEHAMERCPIYRSVQPDTKKANAFTIPCGYAVEGLGFYYINSPESFKNKVESKTEMIRVSGGSLTAANVTSEMERLFPGGWRWIVEETGANTFRTVFPSRAEMQRMVEWGVLHTKFTGVTLRFEESVGGDEVKFAMPKVWVQFTGLPKELREFVTIWAIGSILGVSKAVDMKFTRKHDICRLQVLVLDPNIIPQFVDVVIGDYLYGL